MLLSAIDMRRLPIFTRLAKDIPKGWFEPSNRAGLAKHLLRTLSLMPDLTGSSNGISEGLTGRKLNIDGSDIAGASALDFTSATKAFRKALGTHSRIPLFHVLSKSIASLDDARRKAAA
ncbi:unnamed protein product [Alopecurus aequalis]